MSVLKKSFKSKRKFNDEISSECKNLKQVHKHTLKLYYNLMAMNNRVSDIKVPIFVLLVIGIVLLVMWLARCIYKCCCRARPEEPVVIRTNEFLEGRVMTVDAVELFKEMDRILERDLGACPAQRQLAERQTICV